MSVVCQRHTSYKYHIYYAHVLFIAAQGRQTKLFQQFIWFSWLLSWYSFWHEWYSTIVFRIFFPILPLLLKSYESMLIKLFSILVYSCVHTPILILIWNLRRCRKIKHDRGIGDHKSEKWNTLQFFCKQQAIEDLIWWSVYRNYKDYPRLPPIKWETEIILKPEYNRPKLYIIPLSEILFSELLVASNEGESSTVVSGGLW